MSLRPVELLGTLLIIPGEACERNQKLISSRPLPSIVEICSRPRRSHAMLKTNEDIFHAHFLLFGLLLVVVLPGELGPGFGFGSIWGRSEILRDKRIKIIHTEDYFGRIIGHWIRWIRWHVSFWGSLRFWV